MTGSEMMPNQQWGEDTRPVKSSQLQTDAMKNTPYNTLMQKVGHLKIILSIILLTLCAANIQQIILLETTHFSLD